MDKRSIFLGIALFGLVSFGYADVSVNQAPGQGQVNGAGGSVSQMSKENQEKFMKEFLIQLQKQGYTVVQTNEGSYIQDMRTGMTWKVVMNSKGEVSLQPGK